jgi:hypothetical protein
MGEGGGAEARWAGAGGARSAAGVDGNLEIGHRASEIWDCRDGSGRTRRAASEIWNFGSGCNWTGGARSESGAAPGCRRPWGRVRDPALLQLRVFADRHAGDTGGRAGAGDLGDMGVDFLVASIRVQPRLGEEFPLRRVGRRLPFGPIAAQREGAS